VTNRDRLDTLEASHVALMTDFELFVKEHEKRVEEQDREWERQQQRWARYDAQRQEERERGEAIDRRIGDLVTAIGKLIETRNP
jgi:hypothetical protein